jgi:hypothetical protein
MFEPVATLGAIVDVRGTTSSKPQENRLAIAIRWQVQSQEARCCLLMSLKSS